jgi:hypothetical protein
LTQLVTLTRYELDITAFVGKRRELVYREGHLPRGKGSSADNPDQAMRNNIRGAQSEFAASIALNLYWRPSIGDRRQPDVGGYVEVRSIEEQNHRLVVKKSDLLKCHPSTPFVLVYTTWSEQFVVIGWCAAGRALEVGEPNTDRDPLYFVNQASLEHLDLLPRPEEYFKAVQRG